MGLACLVVVFQPMLEAAAPFADVLVSAFNGREVMLVLVGRPALCGPGAGSPGLWHLRLGVELDESNQGFQHGRGFAPEGGHPAYNFRVVIVKRNGFCSLIY